jgi:chemotaxis signal transduction protein
MGERQGDDLVELLLFRVASHGYASLRGQVLQVVDVGTGLDPVPGLGPSNLGALSDSQGIVGMAGLRRVLGLPERGPEGRLLVAETSAGPFGFLVDEVVTVARVPSTEVGAVSARLGSGYVTAAVSFEGISWSLVDWNALRAAAETPPPR